MGTRLWEPGDQMWEPDLQDFLEAYSKAPSVKHLARALGTNDRTLRRYAKRHNIDLEPIKRYSQGRTTPPEPDEPAPPLTTEEVLKLCEAHGIDVVKDPFAEDREYQVTTPVLDGQGSFKIGVVSDPHLGSKKQQLTYLNAAYDYFDRHGIATVLNPGDVTAGSDTMHKGIALEFFLHGADEQVDYAVEAYPQRTDITTHVISGNHDHSHLKSGGSNVVKRICDRRSDLEYLGMSGAYITLNGIRFYIHHPSGGVGYARSYRLQKQIEQFAPELKPKVLVSGHTHVTCVLESYRNVFGFMAGCFEAQTAYLVEKGIYPELGFSTLTVEYDDEGAVSFEKKWIPFYVPNEHDYSTP